MKKALFTISRIIIGLVFIISGFVKAVDPTGTAIKFTDYFSAFHIEWLTNLAFPLAILIASAEFLTGIHLLIGFRNRLFTSIALLLMLIFTPLTFFIALYNPVTDCGCFGDALKLTNWQTFYKNIVLIFPSIYIYKNRKNFTSSIKSLRAFALSLSFIIFILGVSLYSLSHLPQIDFRPYHIGANIKKGMEIPEDAEQPVYETTFTLEKNGQRKVFTSQNYPYNDTTWVFIDSQTKTISEGYHPPIHDFVLIDEEGNDFTQELLNTEEPTLLIVSSQIKKGNWEVAFNKLEAIKNQAQSQGINTYVLTASPNEDITEFEFADNGGFTYLSGDETMLKTIIRSNPGLLLIENSNIIGKWHYNDIPDVESFKDPIPFAIKQQQSKQNKYWLYSCGLVLILLTIVLYKKEII